MIKTVSEKLFNTYSDVRIYIIGYKEDEATFYFQTKGSASVPQYPYMTNIGEVNAALNTMQYTTTSAYCNRGKAFSKMMNEIEFRNTAGKFVFQIMNGSTNVSGGYFSELDACAKLSINYSEISLPGYSYFDPAYGLKVSNAIANTKGLDLVFGSTTGDTIYNHIVKYVAPATVKYNVIIPTKWEPIELDDILSPDNGANSDTDSLTDWEEVDTESGLITWDAHGNIQLPTFKDIVAQPDVKQYVTDDFEYYQNIVPSYIWNQFMVQEVLPINSNPCDEDSDGDVLDDDIDPIPLKKFDERFMVKDNFDEIPNIDFVDRHLERGNACYDKKIEKWNQNLLYMKYCIYALGGYISPVQSWMAKDNTEDYSWAIAPKYAYFLDYYLSDTGITMSLSNEEMYSIIYGQKSNREHYSYNINQLKNAAEEIIKLNGDSTNKIYISTTSGNNFKCACYKGHNCNAHGYLYDDAIAAGWGYAIGEALCGMTGEVYTYGNKYCMKVKYYLIDTYEFPVHWDEDDAKEQVNTEAHNLHEWGLAKEYKIIGVHEDFITWEKGDIVYSNDYRNILIDTSEYDKLSIS